MSGEEKERAKIGEERQDGEDDEKMMLMKKKGL